MTPAWMQLGDGDDDVREEHGLSTARKSDADGAPTGKIVGGGEKEVTGGGRSSRRRLALG